jgi:formylglycine-generating enzyme required for sulfatase activity
MNRKRIILVALAAVLLAVVAGIAVWRLLVPEPAPAPTGLSVPIEMVEIQPGAFLMGSPEDEEDRNYFETRHPVRITYAFKMGKTEVTQRQWREVMGTTIQQQRDKAQQKGGGLPSLANRFSEQGLKIKDNPYGAFKEIIDKGLWSKLKWLAVGTEYRLPLHGEGDDYPMYHVSWDEAAEFCKRLTEQELVAGRLPAGMVYSLPTEAEWEYACRAGSTTRFANGDTEADLDKIGWYDGNSGNTTHPVGTKLPNDWGLYDMHGNVAEWCHDRYWYDYYPNGEAVDPSGPVKGHSRSFRGGGWSNPSRYCRSADRSSITPGDGIAFLGFRITRSRSE